MPEVTRLGETFGLSDVVLVGDRGMISEAHIEQLRELDGLYVLRTSVDSEQMDSPECVRNCKARANAERAFRSLKTESECSQPAHGEMSLCH